MRKIITYSTIVITFLSVFYVSYSHRANDFNMNLSVYSLTESDHTLKIDIEAGEAKKVIDSISTFAFLSPSNNELAIPLNSKPFYKNHSLYIGFPPLFAGKYIYKNKFLDFYIVTEGQNNNHDLTACGNATLIEQCYIAVYKNILFFDNDPKKYLDLLDNSKITSLHNICHTLAHQLGEEEILINPDIKLAKTLGTTTCLNGYEHGLLEGYSLRTTAEKLMKEFPSLCLESESFESESCYHTLGHVAYFRTGNLKNALKYCLALSSVSNFAISGCSDGVTMSYLIDYGSDRAEYKLYPQISNVFDFCKSYGEENLIAGCFGQLNFYYNGKLNQAVYKEIALGCSQSALSSISIEGCYTSFGRLIASSNTDPVKAIQICVDNIDPKLYEQLSDCVIGAAIYTSFAYLNGETYLETFCLAIKKYNLKPESCALLRRFFTKTSAQ